MFDRSGLSLDRLRSFLAVVDAGGIARAAPGDPVRQSQLSRQLGELEEFFGRPLALRRGRGLAVTAAGEQLAIVVRELIAGLHAVVERDEPIAATLGAGDSLLHGWIIARLPQLDGITLTLGSMHGGEAIARLLDARLDLGVALATEVPGSLRSRPLGTVGFALYVPRALKQRAIDSALPSGVLRAPAKPGHAIDELPLATQYGDPEIAAAVAKLAPRPALVCETFPQAQRAVMTERYAAVLPTLARHELPARRFVELALPALPKRKLVLAWHRRLERQRPQVAAAIPELVTALALERAR